MDAVMEELQVNQHKKALFIFQLWDVYIVSLTWSENSQFLFEKREKWVYTKQKLVLVYLCAKNSKAIEFSRCFYFHRLCTRTERQVLISTDSVKLHVWAQYCIKTLIMSIFRLRTS